MAKLELFLHIGLPKTGSTAIQTWLSRNAPSLERSDICYADLFQSSTLTSRTVGNGFALFPYLAPTLAGHSVDDDKIERELLETYFRSKSRAVISAEILHNAETDRLERFRRFLDSKNCRVKILVFVRDVYARCHSLYLQRLNATGYHQDFGQYAADAYIEDQYDVLSKWSRHFPCMTVVNYDLSKNNLAGTVCDFLGIDHHALDYAEMDYANRTISTREAALLRGLNKLHGGQFSERLSEALMRAVPDAVHAHPVEPGVVEVLRQKSQPGVDALNRAFLADRPESWVQIIREPCGNDVPVAEDDANDPGTRGFLAIAEILIDHIRRQEVQIALLKANAARTEGAITAAEEHFRDALADLSRPDAPRGLAREVNRSAGRQSFERTKTVSELAAAAWDLLDGGRPPPTG